MVIRITLRSVVWSETVGLRTRPVWDQKKSVLVFGLARCGLGLGLAGLVFCCETRSCHARRHKWSWRTQQLFKYYYFIVSTLCLEHHYCGDQQWLSVHLLKKLNPPSAFVYFRWSWSWSCYFGLGLKNLVLFTSLFKCLYVFICTRSFVC